MEKEKLHEELIIKLKKAGFYHFGTGVETFAERLLRVPSINKKENVSEADQHMVIKGCHGFSPATNDKFGSATPSNTIIKSGSLLELIDKE